MWQYWCQLLPNLGGWVRKDLIGQRNLDYSVVVELDYMGTFVMAGLLMVDNHMDRLRS